MMTPEKIYDAFLSLNSADELQVEQIANYLAKEAGLHIWFYKWNIIAGDNWMEEIEAGLDQSKCCIVFIGNNKIGPWQNEEMRMALEERVSAKTIRVIPVLLPGCDKEEKQSEIPRLLRPLLWVRFYQAINETIALAQLVKGIRGGGTPQLVKHLLANTCPFRGLEIFREQDSPFFFGREVLARQL